MKSFLYIALLSLLVLSCSREVPEPGCVKAEVIGVDPCRQAWYILKLSEEENSKGGFTGQLEAGYVTTDNLPEAYQKEGKQVNLSLERNGEYGPRCPATLMIYPAVRVKQICNADQRF